jgi:two-component system, LytTR family, response regulator
MMTAIIIDDEQNNINNLKTLVEKNCPAVKIVATALNADSGEEIILHFKPDLIFLDIQMPGKGGFELLQSLLSVAFEIIFVTAYDKYAIQAIKFSAIDYLLKPINVADLTTAVEKAAKKITDKKQNEKLENLISFLHNQYNKNSHRIALPTLGETRFVPTNSIIRCESSNNYTTFYLNNKEKFVVSKPIYVYEELLNDYGFIRCHQSHLVNKSFIKSWVKTDSGYLLLEDGMQVPISKNRREAIKKALDI